MLSDAVRPSTGPIDAIIVTPASTDEALYFAQKSAPRLVEEGHVWIVFTLGPDVPDAGLVSESELVEIFAQHDFVADGRTEIDGACVALGFRCTRAATSEPRNEN